ncbi:MAG: HD domain-containing protein [Victivallales bacterium]|nr:HD domain-containing protein [Victivallales bacterium]
MTPRFLTSEAEERLSALARKILDADGSCHDWDHTLRVKRTALKLGAQENADLEVVAAAAILHDIARPQEMADQGKTDHAALGAIQASEILTREGIGDEDFRQQVAHCIRAHRFRSRTGEAPATKEAKVLYDADKLDSLGAIGLARAFHFAGKTGARVHNTPEEALSGHSYGREDSALREFLVKLRFLPQRLLTAAGRELGAERLAFMHEFFARLDRECES